MMNVSSSVLFFFSALGAFNGLLLAGYFFTSKPRKIQHIFLGLLLLMISTRIIKSVFFFFNPQLANEFLQAGLSACFLIGPFLYFYCASGQQRLHKLWVSWPIQLSILIAIILLTITLAPYEKGSTTWSLVFRIINWQWFGYILLSAYLIKPSFIAVWRERRLAKSNDIAQVSVLIGVALIWFAYYTSHYTSYIAGALSFSVVLYFNLMFFILHRRQVNASNNVEKYNDKKITQEQANTHTTQLKCLIKEQGLFQDPTLTINKVAKKLGVSSPYLSQLLNDNIGVTFTNFINEYRIEHAKGLLIENAQKVDDIAYACGFNSTSTFYAVFKKHTNMTPAKYRDRP
jgi:AraC-like DNA-binding protein